MYEINDEYFMCLFIACLIFMWWKGLIINIVIDGNIFGLVYEEGYLLLRSSLRELIGIDCS